MSTGKGAWVTPILALLGLADSGYLAILHWQGELPPCGGYAGCDLVNTSRYADVFGVPVAAFGALLYATLLAAAVWRIRSSGRRWVYGTLLLYALVLAGAVFMAYLTAIELFVLRAVCYWCMALAIVNLLLLILVTREVWSFEPASSLS